MNGRLLMAGALQALGERLVREAEAYLAAVDLFRAEGFAPTWRSDEGSIARTAWRRPMREEQ